MNNELISQASSDTLAARVVVYRSLGIGKDLAVQCMSELVRRRANGDQFDYEAYIESETAKIPKVNITEINKTSQVVFQGFNMIKSFLDKK